MNATQRLLEITTAGQKVDSLERHLTVKEIAEAWHLKDDTVRKILQQMPGVLKRGYPPNTRRKAQELRLAANTYERYGAGLQGAHEVTEARRIAARPIPEDRGGRVRGPEQAFHVGTDLDD